MEFLNCMSLITNIGQKRLALFFSHVNERYIKTPVLFLSESVHFRHLSLNLLNYIEYPAPHLARYLFRKLNNHPSFLKLIYGLQYTITMGAEKHNFNRIYSVDISHQLLILLSDIP